MQLRRRGWLKVSVVRGPSFSNKKASLMTRPGERGGNRLESATPDGGLSNHLAAMRSNAINGSIERQRNGDSCHKPARNCGCRQFHACSGCVLISTSLLQNVAVQDTAPQPLIAIASSISARLSRATLAPRM